ncbi:MAG: type II/IV secretion system ATPase subunit [Candidatus Aenigmatarchaeota archaeon]
MAKVVIKRRVRKTKPIKIESHKEFLLRRSPIVINYMPRKLDEASTVEQLLKRLGIEPTAEQKKTLAKMTGVQKALLMELLREAAKKGKPLSPLDLSNLINDVLLTGRPGAGFGMGGAGGFGFPFPGETKEKKKLTRLSGIPFPNIKTNIKPKDIHFKKEKLRDINIKYPLEPRKPQRNEEIFSYAHIFWDGEGNELRYMVVEPKVGKNEIGLMEEIKEFIREKIDIDFAAVKRYEARNYLYKKIDDALEYLKIELPPTMIKVIRYYVYRDFLGYGKIDPLMHDDNIEDISCDGVDTQIYIVHRDPRFGNIKTNVVFNDWDELDSFVMKLAQRCGKDISMAHPLLNGILSDNSRVQATLATDIARRGSNFTIRKFSTEPFTPITHIFYNTCDVKLAAYIWFALENGRSILVSGGTASGKTSLLNSIAMLVKPQDKIVTIEDTGELQLPNPNWIPEVAREVVEGKGSITLFDLLKESLRQRPDRIVVGEVRGKEAFVLFQSMATGHPGLATIHAESMETLIDRLITPPIDLPPTLLEILDIVVFISRVKRGEKMVRRITSIEEIAGMNYDKRRPLTNTVAKWNPKTDEFEIVGHSVVLKKIMDRIGRDRKDIDQDICDKAKVLEWLAENKIFDYIAVGKYLAEYSANPQKFLEKIGAV